MQDSELDRKNRHLNYSYGKEKQKKIVAYYLLISSVAVFLITLSGFTDGISDSVEYFLYDNLGYTNKWSKTFGPQSFVYLMKDIGALSGKFLIFISIITIALYYRLKGEREHMWKYLSVMLGGILFLIVIKLLFADELPYDPIELIVSNISSFPSGHAFMATVFYLTLAVNITRRQKRTEVKKFIFITSASLIFVIGVSRVLGASHSVTEVLAGWSLGLVWVCSCWLTERFIKINYNLRLK